MSDQGLPSSYLLAHGPEGLAEVLERLFIESENDPQFAAAEHFILYQIGQQRSLIKVETDRQPFHFWYKDLQGRPAPAVVKEIIAGFLLERFHEKEKLKNTVEEH